MLEHCQSAQERWGGVSDIIDRWLLERQEMLVRYLTLTHQLELDDYEACGTLLKSFCEIMVDYISAGHFEVFDQLVKEGQEFDDQEALKTASQSYKSIDSTTQAVLDFNDKYQETDDLDAIDTDLSNLGETLAARFEAEDTMIEVLHVANQDKVTS